MKVVMRKYLGFRVSNKLLFGVKEILIAKSRGISLNSYMTYESILNRMLRCAE